MSNLEKSIVEWRQQLLAAGIKTPDPLDELESHLREEIGQQIKSGMNEQRAFEGAAQQIGKANMLKNEFAKVERKQMKRIITILAGLFGVLFGFAMIWPELGMLHRTGAVPHLRWLLAGTAIVIATGGATFYNIRRHKEARGRKLVSLCLIAVGVLCSAVNVSTFFELSSKEWLWWPPVVAVIVLFFGSCLYLNRTLPVQPTHET